MKKPQNVRFKNEVIPALVEYCEPRGTTHQHVASVATWWFMCMPEQLTKSIGRAFYEWCKSSSTTAHLPADVEPLLQRVAAAIERECDQEAARVSRRDPASGMPSCEKAATPDEAAEQALSEAVEKYNREVGECAPRSKPKTGRGKGRRTG